MGHDVGHVRPTLAAIADRQIEAASFNGERLDGGPELDQAAFHLLQRSRRLGEGHHEIVHPGHSLLDARQAPHLLRQRPDSALCFKRRLSGCVEQKRRGSKQTDTRLLRDHAAVSRRSRLSR